MGRWGQMAERKLIVISWTGICDIIISVEWIEIDEQRSEGRTLNHLKIIREEEKMYTRHKLIWSTNKLI